MPIRVPLKTPALLQRLFPQIRFTIPSVDPVLYLTFDDGPLPQFCPWLLECLKEYNARATFFLVGENVHRNPELVKAIRDAGHSIGNHTQNHLNGFQTKTIDYIANTRLCADELQKYSSEEYAPLFRPPYGKIRPRQVTELRKAGYEIILWDVLSKDYDEALTPEKLYSNVVSRVKAGSILVFHDNKKAEKNLRIALPRILAELSSRGYRFEAISLPRRNLKK
jgi:peptidoglycan/xylan/chitin deacetylase (PgdA/CDA1 family)